VKGGKKNLGGIRSRRREKTPRSGTSDLYRTLLHVVSVSAYEEKKEEIAGGKGNEEEDGREGNRGSESDNINNN